MSKLSDVGLSLDTQASRKQPSFATKLFNVVTGYAYLEQNKIGYIPRQIDLFDLSTQGANGIYRRQRVGDAQNRALTGIAGAVCGGVAGAALTHSFGGAAVGFVAGGSAALWTNAHAIVSKSSKSRAANPS